MVPLKKKSINHFESSLAGTTWHVHYAWSNIASNLCEEKLIIAQLLTRRRLYLHLLICNGNECSSWILWDSRQKNCQFLVPVYNAHPYFWALKGKHCISFLRNYSNFKHIWLKIVFVIDFAIPNFLTISVLETSS